MLAQAVATSIQVPVRGGTVRAEAPADGGTLIRFRLPAPEREPGPGPALAPAATLAGSASGVADS